MRLSGKKAWPTKERMREKRKGWRRRKLVPGRRDKPAPGKTRCENALLYWSTYYKVYYLRFTAALLPRKHRRSLAVLPPSQRPTTSPNSPAFSTNRVYPHGLCSSSLSHECPITPRIFFIHSQRYQTRRALQLFHRVPVSRLIILQDSAFPRLAVEIWNRWWRV